MLCSYWWYIVVADGSSASNGANGDVGAVGAVANGVATILEKQDKVDEEEALSGV